MGPPILGLLAEFMLWPLEAGIYIKFNYIPPPHTRIWLRYVNYIFIMWQHKDTLLNKILDTINNFDSKIKFTWEVEQNETFIFLDVLLILMYFCTVVNNQHGIKRTFYRKPIPNQSTIPKKCSCFFFLQIFCI